MEQQLEQARATQKAAAAAAAARATQQQLERAAGVLMVTLGLWLGRQAVLHLAPLPLPPA
jgi:hypothetical protein